MQSNEEFSVKVMDMLDSQLTKNADRALFELAKKERKPKTSDGDEKGNGFIQTP